AGSLPGRPGVRGRRALARAARGLPGPGDGDDRIRTERSRDWMNTCIVGAGALGGLLGARMALAGFEPTLVDRGLQLEALRDEGLRLVNPGGATLEATGYRTAASCGEAGPHDLVLLCLKAYDLPAIADDLAALEHDETVFVTMQNGIPWWYFQRHDGQFEGTR